MEYKDVVNLIHPNIFQLVRNSCEFDDIYTYGIYIAFVVDKLTDGQKNIMRIFGDDVNYILRILIEININLKFNE